MSEIPKCVILPCPICGESVEVGTSPHGTKLLCRRVSRAGGMRCSYGPSANSLSGAIDAWNALPRTIDAKQQLLIAARDLFEALRPARERPGLTFYDRAKGEILINACEALIRKYVPNAIPLNLFT